MSSAIMKINKNDKISGINHFVIGRKNSNLLIVKSFLDKII
jgi:hypothetical protein